MPITPKVMEYADQFRQQLLANERKAASAMVRYYGAGWRRVNDETVKVVRQLQAKMDAGEELTDYDLRKYEGLVSLRNQIESELTKFSEFAGNTIKQQQSEAIISAYLHSEELIKVSLPVLTSSDGGDYPVALSFYKMPNEAVEALVGFLADGSPLNTLIGGYMGETANGFMDTLVTGLIAGDGPRKTARDLRAAYGMGLTKALQISRTETMRAYRTAAHYQYEQNSDILKGWRRNAAKNERTCMTCIALDGKFYQLNEIMDDHVNGRCAMIPVTKTYAELGIDAPEPEFNPETARDWFIRQNEATQQKMMAHIGKNAWQDWKNGKFTLEDIPKRVVNPVWGNAYVNRGYKELLSGDYTSETWTTPPTQQPRPPLPFYPNMSEYDLETPEGMLAYADALSKYATELDDYAHTYNLSGGELIGVEVKINLANTDARNYELKAEELKLKFDKQAKATAKAVLQRDRLEAMAGVEFPDDYSKLERVRSLGGSTGATLMRDPETGKLYVAKGGASVEHILNEMHADAFYKSLNIRVPAFKEYIVDGQPVKLAEYIEGESLSEYLNHATTRQKRLIFNQIRKGFVADCLSANWDVIGLDLDNIIIDADGKAWRIDNGGAFTFRAQGSNKSFDQWVKELWTMRDDNINPSTSRVFSGMSYDEIAKQMRSLIRRKNNYLEDMPDDLRMLTEMRLETLKDLAKIHKTLRDDLFEEGYVDGFSKHSISMRAFGIIDMFPETLRRKTTRDPVTVYDRNGRRFDNLRGDNSIITNLARYMSQNGGNYDVVSDWAHGQKGSSWSNESQALKYWVYRQRELGLDEYFWLKGPGDAEKLYNAYKKKYGGTVYDDSLQMWNAFNYEFMRNTRFDANNTKQGYVTLTRTEPRQAMEAAGLTRGMTNVIMPRGAAESASIYQNVYVGGAESTVQNVPHHRILGSYFFERYPGYAEGMFLGDAENEFIFIPQGIRFDYVRADYKIPIYTH